MACTAVSYLLQMEKLLLCLYQEYDFSIAESMNY